MSVEGINSAQRTSASLPAEAVTWLLDLFSSVRLGIVLLVLLFVYSWVGSAGFWLPGHLAATSDHAWMHDIYWIIPWTQLHVRQAPGLEMTEFEWFHWWPFLLLIGLLCTNVTTTTLRRIAFKPVNYGVWMIHTGVITLSLSCAWYFNVKVEGDMLLPRKRLTIALASGESASMNCKIGASVTLGEGENQYTCTVQSIDPRWELLSGEDKGQRTYSATLDIERGGESFMRQVLVGYPQYTEDIVRSSDPSQPFTRLRNLTGERIGDSSISVAFDDEVRDHFYLRDTAALYVREVGETTWRERPINNLPRYHDHVSNPANVWPTADPTIQTLGLSNTPQPIDESDGLPLATVTDVLQYAVPDQNFIEGPPSTHLNPAIVVHLEAASQQAEYQLLAFDPMRSSAENGRLAFHWLREEANLAQMMQPARLMVSIEGAAFDETFDITTTSSVDTQLGETGYAFRVENVENNLALDAQTSVSVAMVIISTPDGEEFRRWVFDDAARNRDMPIGQSGPDPSQPALLDDGIRMEYLPGGAPAIVTLLGGPEPDQLRMLLSLPGQQPRVQPIEQHAAVPLDRGVTLTVHRYAPRAVFQTRPFIVPREQRNRDVGQQLAMIGVNVPDAVEQKVYWLPFHLYPFTSGDQSMRRFSYRPARIVLKDGREIEMLFSRESYPLPYDVALEDFRVIEHVGGFTGATNSVRDWQSVVRFREGDSWSGTQAVSMNKPVDNRGWSFFQAQWDPPEPPNSPGLNYTVLGVGNRHGVNAMLATSTLIVIGLIYAFYVKPLIRRRQQREALALAEARRTTNISPPGDGEPATPEEDEGLLTVAGTYVEEDRT